MLDPGTVIDFHYPRTTHLRYVHSAPLILRRVLVESVRDLVREPLTCEEFLRRPYILRSRWLITGIDLARQRRRQFYLGSSLEYRAPSELRIGVYESGRSWPDSILYRPIQPTIEDRRLLMRAILTWRASQYNGRPLRLFAADLRVVA